MTTAIGTMHPLHHRNNIVVSAQSLENRRLISQSQCCRDRVENLLSFIRQHRRQILNRVYNNKK